MVEPMTRSSAGASAVALLRVLSMAVPTNPRLSSSSLNGKLTPISQNPNKNKSMPLFYDIRQHRLTQVYHGFKGRVNYLNLYALRKLFLVSPFNSLFSYSAKIPKMPSCADSPREWM